MATRPQWSPWAAFGRFLESRNECHDAPEGSHRGLTTRQIDLKFALGGNDRPFLDIAYRLARITVDEREFFSEPTGRSA